MRRVLRGIGIVCMLVSWVLGLVMAWSVWGPDGIAASVIIVPLDFVMPFIYWDKVGVFPSTVFLVDAIGIIALLIGASGKQAPEERNA